MGLLLRTQTMDTKPTNAKKAKVSRKKKHANKTIRMAEIKTRNRAVEKHKGRNK